MQTLSSLTIILMLTTLLITISLWLPHPSPDTEKTTPYECGFDPLGTARLPFSMRFFLVAILFLLFDLEIALLLPTPWAINSPSPAYTMNYSLAILALLGAGLVYEWSQGGLEWAE
uniref:NADH dehydrogenase subunit 3 n=1 Tax=Hemidactylus almakhwah TaxID=2897831 RepID=UPI0021B50D4B|nr:NADH dehydrogenase subunit 3 [Hemidactylus almakhwah]UVW80893.1 NADH dehydrogenase subunit 3 [Hemidactylus almakhwah]